MQGQLDLNFGQVQLEPHLSIPLIQPDWEWTAGTGMVLGVLNPVSLLTH